MEFKEYLRDQFSRISIRTVFTLFLIFSLRTRKGKGLYLIIDTRHSGFLHLLHRNLCKYVAAIAALSFNPPFIPRPTVQGEAMANKVIVFWQSGGTPAHGAEFQIKWVRNLILIDTPRFDTRESLSSSLYVLHDIRKTSEFGEKTEQFYKYINKCLKTLFWRSCPCFLHNWQWCIYLCFFSEYSFVPF